MSLLNHITDPVKHMDFCTGSFDLQLNVPNVVDDRPELIQHLVVCRQGRHAQPHVPGRKNELEMAAREMNIKGNNNVGDGSQPRLATISMSGMTHLNRLAANKQW